MGRCLGRMSEWDDTDWGPGLPRNKSPEARPSLVESLGVPPVLPRRMRRA
jgi:hypothetical protein